MPTGRTELFTRGVLNGFLHNTYTAARTGGGTRSTGNAQRGGYRSAPGVGTTNFYLDAGELPFDELLARAEGGVHPGRQRRALGREPDQRRVLRRRDWPADRRAARSGEPLREMTVASTLPEMLAGVTGVGERPPLLLLGRHAAVLFGEMTLAGV